MRKACTFSLVLAICFITTLTCQAETVRGRLLIRDDVPANNRSELVKRLRVITGWRDLRFDNTGLLRWNKEVAGGSQSARELITKLVAGDAVIVIQDASRRADVAFCRVVPARWIHDEFRSVRAFVVLIDFTDFQQITGDREARDAFDVGWGLLHEVNHVVNDSEDPQESNEAGACEDEINKMRSELDLPLRTAYFFLPVPVEANPEFSNQFVRLAFEKRDPHRTKRYWLVWDAAQVGGLAQTQTASLRQQ